jgi:hypothetical protein
MRLLFMPIPYPDQPDFSAVHGILEPGEFYDVNAILQIHRRPGQLHIPAGTPLCQLIPINDQELEVDIELQNDQNRQLEIANRFKTGHTFITKYR